MKRTLIYIDPEAQSESLELLGVMEQMYGPAGSTSYGLCAVVPGDEILRALDYLILIDDNRLEYHDVASLTGCIEQLQTEHRFDAILVPATTFGRMLAPRVAMRLKVGLVADVTAVRRRDG
ncbi:hypothetical protein, partial [Salinispira pacifica]